MLMEAEGLNFDRLRGIVSKWEGKIVHVVGDTIVDSLTHTTMIGGMTRDFRPQACASKTGSIILGARPSLQASRGRRCERCPLDRAGRRSPQGLRP